MIAARSAKPVAATGRLRSLGVAVVALSILWLVETAYGNEPTSPTPVVPQAAADAGTKRPSLDLFLDRLMLAESGGRDKARNPRSTALGPFQFIESTWLDVTRRHFPDDVAKQSTAALLQLRTDRVFSRRVAEAYTRDNAKLLMGAGHQPRYGLLRLAFFAGFGGTHRLLQSEPTARSVAILGPGVAKANPFLHGMSVRDVLARMARDVGALKDVAFEGPAPTAAELEALSVAMVATKLKSIPRPFVVRCNQTLPACRRWVALADARSQKVETKRVQPSRVTGGRDQPARQRRPNQERPLAGR